MSETRGEGGAPVMVEDLFLTESFLIKGRLANKYRRLTTMLNDTEGSFLAVEEATMISLKGDELIHTPSVLINPREIILAHELLELSGDAVWRQLGESNKPVCIWAQYK